MTNERAAKIILDLINAGEAEYRNFSVEEIIAFKKAYVALNQEPVTNADRIRAMTDEELADLISDTVDCCVCLKLRGDQLCGVGCEKIWLALLKQTKVNVEEWTR